MKCSWYLLRLFGGPACRETPSTGGHGTSDRAVRFFLDTFMEGETILILGGFATMPHG
jgi:hypothetical protein